MKNELPLTNRRGKKPKKLCDSTHSDFHNRRCLFLPVTVIIFRWAWEASYGGYRLQNEWFKVNRRELGSEKDSKLKWSQRRRRYKPWGIEMEEAVDSNRLRPLSSRRWCHRRRSASLRFRTASLAKVAMSRATYKTV